MWKRFLKLLSSSNNEETTTKNNTLLITGEIPTIILDLPAMWWETPLSKKADNTIGSYLTPRDKKALSQTGKSFYLFYKNEFSKQRTQINTLFNAKNDQPYNANDLKQLLSHVALGEFEQAEKIWEKDPALLTVCGTVYHPNRTYDKEGKVIADIPAWQNPGRYKYKDCTAWQIALMNSEFEEAEKMGEMMTEAEKQRQFAEIFPNGKIEKYDWDLAKAKQLLEAVFDAVIKSPTINLKKMNEITRTALQELYDYVKPANEHKKGLVFDGNFYVEALELFGKRVSQFTQWDQHLFWAIRIEEYLASLLGTAYLRLHAQGIDNIKENKLLKRDGCKLVDKTSYFAFRRSSDSIPGIHHYVGDQGFVRSFGRSLLEIDFFKTYVKQKQDQGQNYAAVLAQCGTDRDFLKGEPALKRQRVC